MNAEASTRSRIDDAPLKIEIVQTVNVEIERVWDVIATNEDWPEWFPGFRDCSWEAPDRIGRPGARRRVHQPPFRVLEEITAWEAPYHWAMRVVEMKPKVLSRMDETIDLEPDGEGTRTTWRLGAQSVGWVRPFAGLSRRDQERKLRAAVSALQAHA